MELWIRSQDKESLTKVSNISLKEIRKPYTNELDCYGIGTYYDNLQVLGKYTTKERALEVLDEIQDKLGNEDNDLINKLKILENTPIINCSNNDDCEININIELLKNMIIYEMPEE